jgi:AcrR family transcriptional regulator
VTHRERLIEVGAEVLKTEGPGATVAEIARRANVSQSLFFTHFASRDDLIAALADIRIEALRELARTHAGARGPAAERLEAYVWAAAAEIAPHRAYLSNLKGSDPFKFAELHTSVQRLLDDAEHEGAVREGVSAEDLLGLIMAATLSAAPYLHARPELWRRFVAVVVAGLLRRSA